MLRACVRARVAYWESPLRGIPFAGGLFITQIKKRRVYTFRVSFLNQVGAQGRLFS